MTLGNMSNERVYYISLQFDFINVIHFANKLNAYFIIYISEMLINVMS